MKKMLLLLPVLFALAAEEPSSELRLLVPTPQQVECKGKALFFTQNYVLRDRMNFPEPAKAYLRTELKKRLGWNEKDVPGAAVIELFSDAGSRNPEYYTLELSDNAIRIGAGTVAGVHCAVGRFLGVIEQLNIAPAAGKTVFPALVIRDWPDFPFRGLHFQIGGPYSEQCFKNTAGIIDVMGRLGYNHAMLELGGRVECPKHPEITRRPAWPDGKIRDIIAFANARGIKVLPAINGPGHVGAGPRLFPFPGIRDEGNGTKHVKELIMDLSHLEFYPIWFDYIDRVAELFGRPEYFSIGSDEFHDGAPLLEKKLKQKTSEYYPEFLSRTADHLAKMGIKTCAWHDMMVDKKKHTTRFGITTEAANGSAGTLEKIPSNISIMYWEYGYLDRYPVLEEIRARKPDNEIWVTVWADPEGMEHLLKAARSMGITKVLGSIWGYSPHRIGIPSTAEFAWNLKNPWKKDKKFFDGCNDRLFYSRPGGMPTTPGRSLLPDGKPFLIAPDLPPKELPAAWNPQDLAKKKILIHIPGSFEWAHPLAVHVDQPRDGNGLWFYTPAWGKSTRTNIWGQEIAVVNGVITHVSGSVHRSRCYETGDMEIPRDGAVLSMRGIFDARYRRTGDLAGLALPGKTMKIYEIPWILPSDTPICRIALPSGTLHLRLILTVRRPFDRKAFLAELSVVNENRKSVCRLNGRDFITTGPLPSGWTRYLISSGEHPVIGLEYSSPEGLRELEIKPFPDAAMSGVIVSRLDAW